MKQVVLALALVGCGGKAKDDGEIKAPILDEQKARPEPVVAADAETPAVEEPPVAPLEEPTAADLELPTKPGKTGSQAQIAWLAASEAIDAAKLGKWNDASAKFRDAVARVPAGPYFFNLCLALYKEGKFSEALTACNAVRNSEPTPALQTKADLMSTRVKLAARDQGIKVSPSP